jgi:hypothetical protein
MRAHQQGGRRVSTGRPRSGGQNSVLRSPAMRTLEAADAIAARLLARGVLKRARQCDCCRNLLNHVFDRLGSTLFLDDDPAQLILAFEPDERDQLSPQVMAACIVLSGRERTSPMGCDLESVGERLPFCKGSLAA